MSDRACKYCRAEIRWCRDDREQWIALDVEKIPAAQPGAAYVVVGAQDARYIRKDNRGKFGTLYRRHVCAQGKNARALADRQRADAVEAREKAREMAALPENVAIMRLWRKR